MRLADRQTGTLLRTSRRGAGLTLRAAAAKAGTSHSTLAAYEAGRKSPTLPTLLRIFGAYGLAQAGTLGESIRQNIFCF